MNVLATVSRVAASLFFAASATASEPDFTLTTEIFAPYQYRDANGEIVGITANMVKRILDNAGLSKKSEALPWARAYKMASEQENVLIYAMTRTPLREDKFRWLAPLAIGESAVLVYGKGFKPPQPMTVDDMREARLCVLPDTPFLQKLESIGFERGRNVFEFQSVPGGRDGEEQMFFFDPSCDFSVAHWYPFLWLQEQMGIQHPERLFGFYPVPEALFGADLRLYLAASLKFDDALDRRIRESFEELRSNGELYGICHDDFGLDEHACSALAPP